MNRSKPWSFARSGDETGAGSLLLMPEPLHLNLWRCNGIIRRAALPRCRCLRGARSSAERVGVSALRGSRDALPQPLGMKRRGRGGCERLGTAGMGNLEINKYTVVAHEVV